MIAPKSSAQAVQLPPPRHASLLLDVDGTLLDIAATPDAVVVPPDLLVSLRQLRTALGGALAVVSGRPVAQIDALLQDAPYAVAGEHGGAIRHAPDAPVEQATLPRVPPRWLAEAALMIERHPGAVLERKSHGFVLHYRAVPEFGSLLRDALTPLLAESNAFVLLAARKAWEVKPRGADKGIAVAKLLERQPFAGRLPIFIGDDVTDEDGIAIARERGGAGLRVPETFGTASAVRAWLAKAAATEGAWPAW